MPPNVIGQDEAGRLWDILSMLRFAFKRFCNGGDRIAYQLYVRNDNRRPRLVNLVASCGALDTRLPKMTNQQVHEVTPANWAKTLLPQKASA